MAETAKMMAPGAKGQEPEATSRLALSMAPT